MIDNFIQWGLDRDLYKNSTREKQILKYLEEKGELAKAVGKDDRTLVMDAIGDMIVCLTHVTYMICDDEDDLKYLKNDVLGVMKSHSTAFDEVAEIDVYTHFLDDILETDGIISCLKCIASKYDTNLEECMEHAWNEIKDRKGTFVNGLFVKEST